MKTPLYEQIAEVRRELALRERVYPGFIARGKLTAAEAAHHLAVMGAVRTTLEWLDALREEVTDLYVRLRTDAVVAPTRPRADAAGIAGHPAVQAVLDAFPESQIAAVRPLPQRQETEP